MAVSSSPERSPGSGISTADLRRVAVRLAWFIPEAAVFAAFFFIYFVGRGWQEDRVEAGLANADRLIAIERGLGIFVEASWQRWALNHDAVIDAANFTYTTLHMEMLIVTGLVFFLVSIPRYRVLRNTILLSGAIAMPFYWWLPMAPPWLLEGATADTAFIDTVGDMRTAKAGFLSNNYAAIPSFHFGWIMLVMIGVWWFFQSPLLRTLSVAFLAWMSYVIVVTGNHYFLDMVAGGIVVGVAFWLCRRWERWISARPHIEERWFFRRGELRLPF